MAEIEISTRSIVLPFLIKANVFILFAPRSSARPATWDWLVFSGIYLPTIGGVIAIARPGTWA